MRGICDSTDHLEKIDHITFHRFGIRKSDSQSEETTQTKLSRKLSLMIFRCSGWLARIL